MARMNLNIQRFDDLDHDPEQIANILSALNEGVPKITNGIDAINDAINQLIDDWGDGNAVEYGNQFNDAYRVFTDAAVHYVNSIGSWASSTGNAYASQYNVGVSFDYSQYEPSVKVGEFNETNGNGFKGPKDDTIAEPFKNKYNSSMEEIKSGLLKISGAFMSNGDAFPDSVQNEVEATVEQENSKTSQALTELSEAYINYLVKYLDEAISLRSEAQNAAAGAGE